jgi:ParB-like chromosome segregation protein Spo0J
MAVEFSNDSMSRAGALYTDYPENIVIMPELNGRHEHTDVEDLAADIEKNGQLQAVKIRKNDQGQPVLVYGHRRYRAICLLNERNPDNRRKIRCEYTAATDAEAFGMAIRENRCRKDVSPIDDCANITTLRNLFSLTDEDIAAVYFPEAKTDAEKAEALRFVKQRAALVELAPEAAQAVRDGRVKITAAVGLAKLTKDQQRTKVAGTGKVKVSDVTKAPSKAATAPSQPTKAQTKPAAAPSLSKVIFSLLDDVSAEDLNCAENEWLSVKRVKLLELASFCAPETFVTPEEKEPVAA